MTNCALCGKMKPIIEMGCAMARKKIEPIVSLGDESKLTVQKSLPLFSLWRSELTLPEFKILDTYLSRIDSHKPERRAVQFEKGELEKALGVKKLNAQDLKARLKHLMGSVVEVSDNSTKRGFKLVTLFEEAVAEQDENGLWQVSLECTQKSMKYFFNIENLGYLRYKLRCITSLTSRYAYVMFIYLESNRYRRSWEVPLDELKVILNCDREETYKEYKRFNDRLMKRVHKELTEKTECQYKYESIKKGRSVVSVRFTVETLPKVNLEDIDPNQITIEQWQEQGETEKELWQSAIDEFHFTDEQIETLHEVLICIPECRMPQSIVCYDAIDLRRYHYMCIKAAELKNRKNVKNHFAYLLKMLKQDADID